MNGRQHTSHACLQNSRVNIYKVRMWLVAILLILLAVIVSLLLTRAGRMFVPKKGSGETREETLHLRNLHKMTAREFERAPDREFKYEPRYDLELTRALIERAPAVEEMLTSARVCITASEIPYKMPLEPIMRVIVPVQESPGVCQLLAVVQFLNKKVTGSHYGGFLALIGPVYFPLESLRKLFPRLRLLLIDTGDTIDLAQIKKLPPEEIANAADMTVATSVAPELRSLDAIAVYTDRQADSAELFTSVMQRGGSGAIDLTPAFNHPHDLRPWVIGPAHAPNTEKFAEQMMYYNLIIRPYGWYGGHSADITLMNAIARAYCDINSLSVTPKLMKVFTRLLLPIKTQPRAVTLEQIYNSLPMLATNKVADDADYTAAAKLSIPLLYKFKAAMKNLKSLLGEHDGGYIARTSAFSLLGLDAFIDVLYYRFYNVGASKLAADFISELASAGAPKITYSNKSATIGDLTFNVPECVKFDPKEFLKYVLPVEMKYFKNSFGSSVTLTNNDQLLERAIETIKRDYEITKCYMLSTNPLVQLNSPAFDKKLFFQTTGLPTGLDSRTLVVFLTHGLPLSIKHSVMAKLASCGCRIIGVTFIDSRTEKYKGEWAEITQTAPYLINCKTVDTTEGIVLHAVSRKYFVAG